MKEAISPVLTTEQKYINMASKITAIIHYYECGLHEFYKNEISDNLIDELKELLPK
jgi:hypothetical protein